MPHDEAAYRTAMLETRLIGGPKPIETTSARTNRDRWKAQSDAIVHRLVLPGRLAPWPLVIGAGFAA